MLKPNKDSTANNAQALPIHIRGLSKQYGSFYALNDVNLEIHSGEFLTLLGPSGSGKTTLLMAIAGFNRPDRGSIRFGEREMILTPPHRREVGMVFQNYALFPHMSVAGNIGYPLKLRGISSEARARQVAAALETVQLSGLGERRIDQLSGGQRQRVALARAFVFGPRILLMDEPLSALDKKLRERMQIELKHLHRQLGVTTVYVTHDQREALTMSDRIAVINHGQLAQVGPPEAIYNHPANNFVADFIGESTMLPLSCDASKQLYFKQQLIQAAPPDTVIRNWSLVIRPERLFLLDGNLADPAQVIRFTGTVREQVFQGESAFALVAIDAHTEVTIRFGTGSKESTLLTPGQNVSLGLNRNHVILIPADDG